MDNGNCSHLILQDLESNFFQIIIWTSLQLTDKEANGQQSAMLNTKEIMLPFLSSERHKEIADKDLLIRVFFFFLSNQKKKKWQAYQP